MCKSHGSCRSVPVAALGIFAALAASAAVAGTVETRTAFGRIEMVEEAWTLDPGATPLIGMANAWTKLHLRWRSADGLMAVDVIDDGWMITADLSAGVGKPSCSTSINYLQYSGVAGEFEIQPELRAAIARFAKWCPVVSPATGARYAATLADGAVDFVAAENGLRTRTRERFGRSPARCLTPAPPPPGSRNKGPQLPVMALDGPPILPCRK